MLRVAILMLTAFAWAWPSPANAEGYVNAEQLKDTLKALEKKHKKIVRFESRAQSAGKRDVWLVELGKGSDEEKKTRPGVLVVAGIDGDDLIGTAAALFWAEKLVEGYEKSDQLKKILETTTIYVFPRLNPDAAEKFFEKPINETAVSDKPVDEDHDGLIDEDPAEDLNVDKLVTWMRVEDPEGEYILDPSEPRLMMKADAAKGEVGKWKLLREGTDNDKDEKWNEDGLGGVNFNRNFPYGYSYFSGWAGLNPVSEVETRALADFVVDHPNIGIVFTFGAADNLAKTPEPGKEDGEGATEKRTTTGRRSRQAKPATGIDSEDHPYFKELGEIYRKTIGLGKEQKTVSQPGAFSDWMYFHRGRFSLAGRAWSPEAQLQLKEKEEEEKEKEKEKEQGNGKKEKGAGADDRNKDEREFLKWVDQHAPEEFLSWKEYKHPDFVGKRVEIGGWAPYAKTNPPVSELDGIATKDADFLTTLTLKLPRIGIRKFESKHLGRSVYDLTLQVENTGYLPTVLDQGETTREVSPTRIVIDLEDKSFLAGTRITKLAPIPGSGGMKESKFTLYVPRKRKIKISVISALAGTAETVLEIGGE